MNEQKRSLIGLSLSFCVLDILKKKIDIDDVICIVCNARWKNDSDIIAFYQTVSNVWKDIDVKALELVFKQLEGRIYQPRQQGTVFAIPHGYWFDVEKGGMI